MENILARILHLVNNKSVPKEIYLTLEFDTNIVNAQVFEMVGKKVTIIGSTQNKFEQEPENGLIEAVNVAITTLEEKTPEVRKTIFGVPNEWVEEGRIKTRYQLLLKKMSSDLALDPVGFVVSQDAVMFYLGQLEGVPATAVLIGLFEKEVVVSVVRSGKLHGVIRKSILSNISESVKIALKEFIGIEVFPSRMLIYGPRIDLEDIKQELISYPWLQNINFLHFPKIEILENSLDMVTMSYVGSIHIARVEKKRELTLDYPKEPLIKTTILDQKGNEEENAKEQKELPEDEVFKEDTGIEMGTGEDIGFIKNEDILDSADNFETIDNNFVLDKEEKDEKQKNVPEEQLKSTAIHTRDINVGKGIQILSSLKIPKVHISLASFNKLKLPQLKITGWENSPLSNFFQIVGGRVVGIIGLIAIVFLILFFIFYSNLLKAKVVLIVDHKNLEKNSEILATANTTLIDENKKLIPVKIQESIQSGNLGGLATGTKTTGEKAKGQVIIYNKTSSDKTFPAGTILTSETYKFILDTVASVSAQAVTESSGGATITYGKAKVNITAANFGTKYNLPANSGFKIGDTQTTAFEAKTEVALSGGTSRDIIVVSKEDQDVLLKKLTQDLLDKAKKEFDSKQDSTSRIIVSSIESSITKKKFSKEIDSETKDFSLDLEMKFKGGTYNDQDLKSLMERLTASEVPSDYVYKSQNAQNIVEEKEVKKDGSVLLGVKFSARLLPKINPEDVKNVLKGKSFAEGKKYLGVLKNVKAANIAFTPKLPEFLLYFPRSSASIAVEVVGD